MYIIILYTNIIVLYIYIYKKEGRKEGGMEGRKKEKEKENEVSFLQIASREVCSVHVGMLYPLIVESVPFLLKAIPAKEGLQSFCCFFPYAYGLCVPHFLFFYLFCGFVY
jgi:hypothetical protein